MSRIVVNKIEGRGLDKTVTVSTGHKIAGADIGSVYAPGTVIQVQNTYSVDPSSQSIPVNNTASYAQDLVGLSVNITPKFSNSKIMLQARWSGEMNPVSSGAWSTMFLFQRNGFPISMPPQPGSLTLGHQPTYLSYYASDNDSTMESCMWDSVDYPSTTATVTYTAAVYTSQSGLTFYNNRCVNASTSGGYERGTSMITVWEIAQ